MNDLYFTAKNKKGLQIKSLSQKVYIIRHDVAVYHQCKALYIIITEFFCTLKRDDIQKRAKKIALFDDIHANKLRDDMPLLRNG